MRLFVVSGTSGAGKSVALNALEDLGFYCIDNLPLGLLPAFSHEMAKGEHPGYAEAAVGIDARNLANDMAEIATHLTTLEAAGIEARILFLDADDATLLKRFSETRRRHPLTREGQSLAEAITRERALLAPLASRADLRLDTSHSNVHQLREQIRTRLGDGESGTLSVLFESFGYKHGVPVDADFVFDIRCLPNPHWEPRLRALTGRDEEVIRFLQHREEVEAMFDSIRSFLDTWLPCFKRDNRSYLTVAVGCTGGQHRSVYLSERLSRHFATADDLRTLCRHRELS